MISLPGHIPDSGRLNTLRALVACLLGCIVLRLWYLQLVKGQELADRADIQSNKVIRRIATRGIIEDRNGKVLATSRTKFVVSVTPDDVKKFPLVLTRLAKLLDSTEDDLQQTMYENSIGNARFDPIPVARDVNIKVLTQIEEQRLDLPGVIVTREPVRYYTDNQVCTHLLGVTRPISREKLAAARSDSYRGGDYVGVMGLEMRYEAELRGRDGGQKIAVDAIGRLQHTLGTDPPRPGHTLRLSLDYELQKVAYDSLMKQFQGEGRKPGKHPGAAVALDPKTGEVLAFVSVPSYDLNNYGTQISELLKDREFSPLINRASGAAYPCGSPYKLVTAAAALDAGKVSHDTTYYCAGRIRRNGRTFYCDLKSGHGSVDFERGIAASCDVYFWSVAESIGPDKIAAMATRFGLGAKTGIDLPPTVDKAGSVPSPEAKRRVSSTPWYKGDTLNTAIGQGDVRVTPLQLACYTAAIANGGHLLRPQLVHQEIDLSSGRPIVVRQATPEVRGEIGLSDKNRQLLVAAMRRVMKPGGTGVGSDIPDLDIAGKTGTAETFFHGQNKPHSIFVCFAPADNPRIAIAVFVENGGQGAETAAPIARQMLAQYFHKKVDALPSFASYGTRD